MKKIHILIYNPLFTCGIAHQNRDFAADCFKKKKNEKMHKTLSHMKRDYFLFELYVIVMIRFYISKQRWYNLIWKCFLKFDFCCQSSLPLFICCITWFRNFTKALQNKFNNTTKLSTATTQCLLPSQPPCQIASACPPPGGGGGLKYIGVGLHMHEKKKKQVKGFLFLQ